MILNVLFLKFFKISSIILRTLENKNKVTPNCIGKEFVQQHLLISIEKKTIVSKDPHVVQSSISNTPIRTEIKATPRYEETPIKRTITVTNVKTVKSSSISGMNGRNRLYDDDLLTMIDIKSPTTRKFQGEKRDEDIRLIPKSSNIGSSKYKPV